MRQKAVTPESPSERIVNDIHPATPEALFGRALDHCCGQVRGVLDSLAGCFSFALVFVMPFLASYSCESAR